MYDHAIQINPNHDEAYNNKGMIFIFLFYFSGIALAKLGDYN